MKKFIPAITLITLLSLQVPVQATWSSQSNARAKEKEKKAEALANTPGFCLHDNRMGFLEIDYLFWKPQMENCFSGMKISSSSISTGSSENLVAKGKLKQPSFDLSSGVRVGIGGYNSDSWDVGLRGTYLYSNARKHLRADPSNGTINAPDWYGSVFGLNGVRSKSRWQMNFGLLDLTFGREYFLTKRFAAHPFIGLRGAIIRQTNHVHYSALFSLAQLVGPALNEIHATKFRAKSNIWGIGPRAGFDLNFYVSKEWSFLGGFAGSLLYTHYLVREKFNGMVVVEAGGPQTLNPVFLKVKDRSSFGRANLDAYFGLGWNHWFNDAKNRVAIAVAFEAQQWFGLNQWFVLDQTGNGISTSVLNTSVLNVRADKTTGDLSLIGGTVHFQIDF